MTFDMTERALRSPTFLNNFELPETSENMMQAWSLDIIDNPELINHPEEAKWIKHVVYWLYSLE